MSLIQLFVIVVVSGIVLMNGGSAQETETEIKNLDRVKTEEEMLQYVGHRVKVSGILNANAVLGAVIETANLPVYIVPPQSKVVWKEPVIFQRLEGRKVTAYGKLLFHKAEPFVDRSMARRPDFFYLDASSTVLEKAD